MEQAKRILAAVVVCLGIGVLLGAGGGASLVNYGGTDIISADSSNVVHFNHAAVTYDGANASALGLLFGRISRPTTPAANTLSLFMDNGNNHLSVKDQSGAVTDLMTPPVTAPNPLSYVKQMVNLGRTAADGTSNNPFGYGMQFMADTGGSGTTLTTGGVELFWLYSGSTTDNLTCYLWDVPNNTLLTSKTTVLSSSGYSTVTWTSPVGLVKGHKYGVSYYVTNKSYAVWLTNSASTGTLTDFPGMNSSTPTYSQGALPTPAGDRIWYYKLNVFATSAGTQPTNDAGGGNCAPIGPLFQ